MDGEGASNLCAIPGGVRERKGRCSFLPFLRVASSFWKLLRRSYFTASGMRAFLRELRVVNYYVFLRRRAVCDMCVGRLACDCSDFGTNEVLRYVDRYRFLVDRVVNNCSRRANEGCRLMDSKDNGLVLRSGLMACGKVPRILAFLSNIIFGINDNGFYCRGIF